MSSPFKTWLTHLPLAREKFFVLRHEGKWKIRHEERLDGPYIIQGAAISAAVDKAYHVGRQGTGAQVFVQVKGDEFRLEWTYGLDANPA